MLEEARVFDGQHSVLHDLGDFLDGGEIAPFFAEFTQQRAFRGVDPKRQLGAVVRQIRDVGQIGVGHRQCHGDGQQQAQRARDGQARGPENEADQPAEPGGTGASGSGSRRVGWLLLWRRGRRHIAPIGGGTIIKMSGLFQGKGGEGSDQRSRRPLYGLAIAQSPPNQSCGFGNALDRSDGENSLPVNYLTDSIHVKC